MCCENRQILRETSPFFCRDRCAGLRRHRPARASPGCGLLTGLAIAILLSGCASPDAPRSPRLERLAPEAAQPPPAALRPFDLVRAVREGVSAESLVRLWRDDGARLPLDAGTLIELHTGGVPVTHLDALLSARELALRTDFETRIAAERAAAATTLAAERSRPALCPAPAYPSYWRVHPYGGWGAPGGWFGGFGYGW